jgi:hypothetical protein
MTGDSPDWYQGRAPALVCHKRTANRKAFDDRCTATDEGRIDDLLNDREH